MKKITQFRTKDQREFNKISDRADKNLKEYQEMIDGKIEKLNEEGTLSESDIDEMMLGMAILARDGIEMNEALGKINPDALNEKKKITEKALKAAKSDFLKEEYGLEIIK